MAILRETRDVLRVQIGAAFQVVLVGTTRRTDDEHPPRR